MYRGAEGGFCGSVTVFVTDGWTAALALLLKLGKSPGTYNDVKLKTMM